MLRQDRGEVIDEDERDRQIATAVESVIRRQLDAGIDIGNDGEQPRVAFHTYVVRRMQGFGGGWARPVRRDVTDFPDFAAMWRVRQQSTGRPQLTPQAVAEVTYTDANIPPDRVRLHVCWGNSEGPHTHDVSLEAILPLLYHANVGALSIELANPRHQHEYAVIKRYPLPDTMRFMPGVMDTTTHYVEHPEGVANRICEAVAAGGDRHRVIASTDCGFGTYVGWNQVTADVVWAKLRALVEGAARATKRLWG